MSDPRPDLMSVLKNAKVEAYGVVRDKHGKPRIDGPVKDLHPKIRAQLTPNELAELEQRNG